MGYPQSIEACVNDLASRLTPEQIEQVAEFESANAFASATHWTYGLFCRNAYGLYDNNQALFREVAARNPKLGNVQPDDVSGVILREFYAYALDFVEAGA
ncbi:MAG TPA: DUF6794 domain-containing protein [Ktedonobacteraceae bacterium]